MKKIVLLFLLILSLALVGCQKESKTNLLYSEHFVDEDIVDILEKPQIVIVFKNSLEIDKPGVSDKLSIQEVKDIIKDQREKNKEFYSINNKKLLDSMSLNLENEKVFISNYSNCIFIELNENKSNSYYDELLLTISSYDFVLETYYK